MEEIDDFAAFICYNMILSSLPVDQRGRGDFGEYLRAPGDSFAAGSCAATERWSSRLTITAPDNIEPAGLAIIVFYDTMLHIT